MDAYYQSRNDGAYSRKAKANNLKQRAEIICFLVENRIHTFPEPEEKVKEMFHEVSVISDAVRNNENEASGAETLNLGSKDFFAEDGAQDVQWTSVLRRPERSGDLEPWVQGTLRLKQKGLSLRLNPFVLMRKMGLEPTRLQ